MMLAGLDWSDEAPALVEMFSSEYQDGIVSHECATFGFLYGYFKSLRLKNLRVDRIDPAFSSFVALQELNLSGNNISIIENIPPNVNVISFRLCCSSDWS